jgi:hypothetical protein
LPRFSLVPKTQSADLVEFFTKFLIQKKCSYTLKFNVKRDSKVLVVYLKRRIMMRSRLLLRTFIAVSLFVGMASATTYSGKTFLAPRAVGTNLPMELTTWHEYPYQMLAKKQGHRVRAHFELTPFYQASDNKEDLGKYFGIGNCKNCFVVGKDTEVTAKTADIDGLFLIHNASNIDDVAKGTISFNPKQEIWGARLDYFQDIDHPIKGLFFKASMPIVYVENSLNMCIGNSTSVEVGGKTFSLNDFFAGNVEVTEAMDALSQQSPLCYAKIGCSGKESKVGIADINLALGYKIHQSDSAHVFLSAQAIVPTGSRPNGEYLWAPVIGNGKHFGLGARLDTAVQLWSNKNASVRMLFDVDYRYLFESSEYRTLGLKGCDNPYKFAHYYLAGRLGQDNKPLFPAANILTQSIKVKPGSQFDILADLSFKSSGFVIDLGYNFFYKDEEDCWSKCFCSSGCCGTSCESTCGERCCSTGCCWEDGVYGIVNPDYVTNDTLVANDFVKTLNASDLDVSTVQTPSQVTHKIYAGLGYGFDIAKRFPALFGIGGSYEFVSDNSALEGYALWVKFGVSF